MSIWGVIRNGKIEPAQDIELPEGATVIVTLLPEDDDRFWQKVSESSLAAVWDNPEDDVYAELL
jgi:hypothetical protein